MKKNLLIVTALVLSSFISNAQVWNLQNTMFPVQLTGVNDISVPAPNVAWITGYDGNGTDNASNTLNDFSRTTDGGITWVAGSVGPLTDTIYQFSNISAVNADTAWVCRFNQMTQLNGGIWKTTNGGVTWNRQDTTMFTGPNAFADFVHFWNGDTGVAVGDPQGGRFQIYTTTNGGANWTQVAQGNIPVEQSGEFGLTDLYDWYGNTIWFATSKGRVYKSTNNGLNWTVTSVVTLSAVQVMKVKFLDSNNGLASIVDTGGTLISLRRTFDGGATWAIQTTTGKFFTNDFGRIPGSGLYMSTGADPDSGQFGSSYTNDGGATWIIIGVGVDTVQHTSFGSYDINNTWSGSFNSFDASFNNLGGIFKLDSTGIVPVAVINPDNFKADINAYPNPSSGIVTMNFKTERNVDVNATVINMMGEQVYNSKFPNVSIFTDTFDFSWLPKGVYMLNLEYGSERSTQKLVIQ